MVITLKNRRLSTQLGLIFTLILMLMLGIAFVGWFGQQQAVEHIAKIMNIEDFLKSLYQTRLQEKDFVIHNDELSALRFQTYLKGLSEQTSQLATLFNNNQLQIDSIIADVKDYEQSFSAYLDIMKQKEITASEMNKVANEVLQKIFMLNSSQRQLLKSSIDEVEMMINTKLNTENYVDQLMRLFMETRVLQTSLLYEYDTRQALSVESLSEQFLKMTEKLLANSHSQRDIDKLNFIIQTFHTYRQQYKDYIARKENILFRGKQPEDEENIQNIEFTVAEIIRNLQNFQYEQFANLREAIAVTNRSADERLNKLYYANQILHYYLLARQQESLYFNDGQQSYLTQVIYFLGNALKFTHDLISTLKNPTHLALVNELVEIFKRYVSELEKYVALESQHRQLSIKMDDNAYQTVQNIHTILENQEDLIILEMKNNLSIILGLVVIAMLIGIASASWITRLITSGLNDNIKLLEKIAAGDLRKNIRVETHDELGKLRGALHDMQSHLYGVVKQVRETSDRLFHMANKISLTSKALSDGALQQAAGVEQISAAMEEITATIEQNADNARHTREIAQSSSQRAADGGQAVSETVSAMQQIATKVQIVEEVAYKTNLLALNAAIEAARAGEHGSGFAVVAEEVRMLAEHTQTAAREILHLVGNSVQVAEKAGNLLKEIVPSAQHTAQLVEDISYSSQEQAAGIKQINATMISLDHVTQRNAAASETLAATAETMHHEADRLQQLMLFFKLQDNDTLERLPPIQ